MMTIIANQTPEVYSSGLIKVWEFLSAGGIFMLCIALCSCVALAVIFLKFYTLRKQTVVPSSLEEEVLKIEEYLENREIEKLKTLLENDQSALSRLCQVVFKHAGRTQGEVTGAVQSSAREEIVHMNTGMSVLEVVITIAPLLGLLGTASGLVMVFSDLENTSGVAKGIGVALYTTIAGLAVAVPAVIAHSYFDRKIETFSARLEVLLGRVVSACHQHVFFKNRG